MDVGWGWSTYTPFGDMAVTVQISFGAGRVLAFYHLFSFSTTLSLGKGLTVSQKWSQQLELGLRMFSRE